MWLVLLFTAGAWGQDVTARDLTVRMFDTDRVGAVTVTPLSGAVTWKACPGCAFQALGRAVTVKSGAAVGVVVLGDVRVETDTRRKASAAGSWRVDSERDGLRVRVTLPSERYVAAVLSGEAAADEPPASLRALAVVVRSYAMTHPGELTDSTKTQVLRLGAVSGAIADAVRETAGETLWVGGRQVPGYFTQSSGGVTEASSVAWGGVAQVWLRSQADPASERAPSQWHAEIGLEELRQALVREGFAVVGPVREIAVVRRTGSGRVGRIRVGGFEMAGPAFRFAMGRELGWNRLRSDLYTVRVVGQSAVFEGKGYGHGVGLSQAGARVMAGEGRDAGAILRFYFPGAAVRVTAQDAGWQTRDGVGWTLVSTAPDGEMVKKGDEAWRRARGLVRVSEAVHPVVRVFPTVALFRGVTGEPGWTLAATRGERIFMQPAGVRAPGLLLHEMLHVLVEARASDGVPLWFREGLVEALAEPGGSMEVGLVKDVEGKLERPGSLAEAQVAHREAGAMVRRLVKGYGVGVVVGWLTSGVPQGRE
ncbi:SpoIID/LytB domain-containing protein [Granulicella pectinivorans]|uniref:SpoIID/LytB domain-containing protein n=1 Tax=Granulicella pectinivorans TaxID=474950 RepID=UPI00158775A7|nr:SpoIID/LytB domain-containing protein [Granulicella pectinivorans]